MTTVTRSDLTSETHGSLLDAAERLFAEHGIAGSSLRSITRDAGANLASVHYHFGSKEGLVRAVIARCLEPINRQRLEMLETCMADDDEPQLECILRAFVGPVLAMMDEGDTGRPNRMTLLGRAFAEPDDSIRGLMLDEFREVFERFLEALARALPELPPAELFWRFHFVIGTMAHTAAAGYITEHLSRQFGADRSVEGITCRMVDFLAAGLRAPIPREEKA